MKGNVCGYFVAVVPDEIETVSEGGIVLTEDFNENLAARAEAARTTGVIVSIGHSAWRAYDGDWEDWEPWAEIGDRVHFQRHVAKIIEDKENLNKQGRPTMIFIMNDQNITWNEGKADE